MILDRLDSNVNEKSGLNKSTIPGGMIQIDSKNQRITLLPLPDDWQSHGVCGENLNRLTKRYIGTTLIAPFAVR
ncbi:MAG: hypothetical protein NT027_20530 [Proteobacteria bacterium]|nr:hypothetical protein [Pseudomonadota bacterium]